MHYKIKSAIQWFMSILPAGSALNRIMQIYITRSLPISAKQFHSRTLIADRHLETYLKQNGRLPVDVLDIGSGSDLALPILMARCGAKVTASDINRLATKSLINDMLSRVDAASLDDLGVNYIVYNPPTLPFDNNTFDLITSSSVLEHVPRHQIDKLAAELYRILRRNGVSTHHIAHKDHWSDTDNSLHSMNYLQYNEKIWRRYNPPLQHQNRLLSPEYVDIFRKAGFVVQKEVTIGPPVTFKVDEQFSHFSHSDLRTTHTWLKLTK